MEFKVGDKVKVKKVINLMGNKGPLGFAFNETHMSPYLDRTTTVANINNKGRITLKASGNWVWDPDWIEHVVKPTKKQDEFNLFEVL